MSIIYRKIVIDIATGKVLKARREFYLSAKIALAKGGGGGGQQQSTTTSSTALPEWLQPYAQNFIQTYAGQAFNIDPTTGQYSLKPAPGGLQQGVAGFTPDQLAAQEQIRGMNPIAQQSALNTLGQANQTVSGQYLNPATNPYLSDTYNLAARNVTNQFQTGIMPGIISSSQRAGQFGGSAMQELMGNAMTNYQSGLQDLATQIYGGNYQQERGRQMQAMGMMPQTMAGIYAPAYQLAGVGAQQQNLQQAMMDTGYANAVQAAEYPYSILSGFGGALGQAGMGAGTSQTRTTGSAAPGGGK